MGNLQGFFNALAYGLNASVRRLWQDLLIRKGILSASPQFLEMSDAYNVQMSEMDGDSTGNPFRTPILRALLPALLLTYNL